jgi:hypothetical protein
MHDQWLVEDDEIGVCSVDEAVNARGADNDETTNVMVEWINARRTGTRRGELSLGTTAR